MADDSQQWVTVPEAGRLLNKSERTIHRWVSTGKLSSRKESGRLFVEVSDFMPVIGSGEVSDMSSVAVLRAEVGRLQLQVDKLTFQVEQVSGERDYLRGALAQALRMQQVAIQEPGQKRSWWPPWKSED